MSENVLSLVVVGGGLLAIALTLWFGLQSFKGGITEKLQKMSEDLTAIRTKQDALWDIVAAEAPILPNARTDEEAPSAAAGTARAAGRSRPQCRRAESPVDGGLARSAMESPPAM